MGELRRSRYNSLRLQYEHSPEFLGLSAKEFERREPEGCNQQMGPSPIAYSVASQSIGLVV